VQRLDVHALVAQAPVELVAADLRAHEDDRLVGPLGGEDLDELVGLLVGLGLVAELLDAVDGQRGRLDLDVDRVVEVAVGELADRRRHRRAEQRGLAAVGGQRKDALDVLEEPEVEHLVGLVEHDEATVVEDQRRALDQVEHAADGADHDVPTGTQLGLLRADRRAAEDGDDVDALARAVGADRLGDLDAQLARGREHQRLDLTDLGIDGLEQRKAERRSLARAGLGLADDVAALEHRRDRLLLDRARRFVAHVVEGLEQRLAEPEVLERRHA
jgi:hypothetical protein